MYSIRMYSSIYRFKSIAAANTSRLLSTAASASVSVSNSNSNSNQFSFNIASMQLVNISIMDIKSIIKQQSASAVSNYQFLTPAQLQNPQQFNRLIDNINSNNNTDSNCTTTNNNNIYLISKSNIKQLYTAINHNQSQQQYQQLLNNQSQSLLINNNIQSTATTTTTAAADQLILSNNTDSNNPALIALNKQLSSITGLSLTAICDNYNNQLKSLSQSAILPPKTNSNSRLYNHAETELLQSIIDNNIIRARELLTISANNTNNTNSTDSTSIDINVPSVIHGGSFLHTAALHGHTELIQLLLHYGADINSRSFNYSTPLHWCCGAGIYESVELLLRLGADPTLRTVTWYTNTFGKSSSQTPAHWASESGHSSILSLLQQYAPGTLLTIDERQNSPLLLAKRENKRDSISYLNSIINEEYIAVKLELKFQAQRII